jgi:type I restriction enzyme, S subunit
MLSVYREHGVVRKSSRNDNHNQTAEGRDIYQLVDDGWFIVNRMKAWQGSVGISSLRGIVSGHYLCFRPKHNENHRFLNWLLRSDLYRVEYARMSRGVRPGQIEIDNDELRRLRITLPSPYEQRVIAGFLDSETSRVDQLRILECRVRTSIEERIVARVDHLFNDLAGRYGAVPFRRMIRSIEQGVSPQCDDHAAESGNWGVLKVSAVRNGTFVEDENKQLPVDNQPSRRHEIKHGDLLITRANTPLLVGSAAVADHPRSKLLLCDKIFRIKTTDELLPEFLVFASLSTRIRAICAGASHGTSQSMVNLRSEEIKHWPVPVAPLAEQRQVVAELREALDDAAKLTAAIDRQLATLSDRRRALITAAVTGQIDGAVV